MLNEDDLFTVQPTCALNQVSDEMSTLDMAVVLNFKKVILD